MSSYGRIKEFRPEEESIESYLERIELFFTTNEIANEKKVVVFLSVVGSKTYTILRSLVAPAKPCSYHCQEARNSENWTLNMLINR